MVEINHLLCIIDISMDRTLSRISIRLNVGLKDLTSKALDQFIVKILYSNDGSMSVNDINDSLRKPMAGKI